MGPHSRRSFFNWVVIASRPSLRSFFNSFFNSLFNSVTIAATLAGAVIAAHAQTSAGPQLGQQIATEGTSGAAACATCHGAQGEGNASAGFPRLAGQPRVYLAQQLKHYASGSRDSTVMAPIAKALDEQQINAVATYYAAITAPATPVSPATAQMQKRGQQLATAGDGKLGVQACISCHEKGSTGTATALPYLSGQHGAYLAATLTAWKNGTRSTDPSLQMNLIAKRLSEADIAALAAYYAAQPAPGAPDAQKGTQAEATSDEEEATSGRGPSGSGQSGAAKGQPRSR